MNKIYKILTVVVFTVSLCVARTSGNYSTADHLLSKKDFHNKPVFADKNHASVDEDSLKWKRRHKRRKKAPNRRPKRGK
tara:strand:- start:169 stop:405 length:237 start_codon:yes stop_codon:yes gene_type:complete